MLFNFINRLISKISGKVHIQTVLIVPFVIQIILAVGLTGYFSFRNGQEAINDLATQLHSEITARIEQYINTLLDIPSLVVNINANAISDGQLNLADLRSWLPYLIKQSKVFDELSYIYFGHQQGDYIALQRTDDGGLAFNIKDSDTGGFMQDYRLDKKDTAFPKSFEALKNLQGIENLQGFTRIFLDNYNPTDLKNPRDYDPRLRLWYQTAVLTGKAVWTKIYPFIGPEGTGELGMSFVYPYYNETNNLQGVLGSDFTLKRISGFLRSLKVGQSGKTFIVERQSGLLVAGSFSHSPLDNKNLRKKVFDVNDNLIKATAKDLSFPHDSFSYITDSFDRHFSYQGQQQRIHVSPFHNRFGLDWLIVVVVPEADFMKQIDINTRMTLLLSMVALVLATLIGIFTSKWIVQPILRLNEAAKKLSRGDWEQSLPVGRADELGKLANSFNSMAKQLKSSFKTLEDQNSELQRLDKLKNEFLANTSHELRTPLNGIISIAESLINGIQGSLPEKTRANLVMIEVSGRRLANLVSNILDFSRLRHQSIELTPTAVNLPEVIDVVFALSMPLIGNKDLQLINVVGKDLPLVYADENRLQQILHNLMSNAIKFTDSGRVEISAKVQEGFVATRLCDTGIGIPEDKLESIFESFEQADGSTARVYGGTGLGLAVTKQLVSLQGGEIGVKSEVGVGSQFTFTLPIANLSK